MMAEGTLARLRREHVCDPWAARVPRCSLDWQAWPCDAIRLLDVAEAARGLMDGSDRHALEHIRAALAALDARGATAA